MTHKDRANIYGVRVAAGGTFTMYGGRIANNEAAQGGGVYSNGTFNMYGGSITDNEAKYGGGVLSGGAFTMYGGSITDNKAADVGGGGVYLWDGTFTVSGAPKITDNTFNSNKSNVYLPNGKMITVGTGGLNQDAATIGVTTKTKPEVNAPVQITMGNATSTTFFRSEEGYEVANDSNNNVVLRVKPSPTASPTIAPTIAPTATPYHGSGGNTYSWYVAPTPTPALPVLPKTGDMTILQRVLAFFGLL